MGRRWRCPAESQGTPSQHAHVDTRRYTSYTSHRDTMGAAHRSKSNMQQASYNSPAESWVLFDGPNVTEATSRLEAKRNYQAFLHNLRSERLTQQLAHAPTQPSPRFYREGGWARHHGARAPNEWIYQSTLRFSACNLSIQISSSSLDLILLDDLITNVHK